MFRGFEAKVKDKILRKGKGVYVESLGFLISKEIIIFAHSIYNNQENGEKFNI